MDTSPQDQDCDARLQAVFGAAPTPDFEAWCESHPDAVEALTHTVSPASTGKDRKFLNRRVVMTSLKVLVASLVVVAGLLWMSSGDQTLSGSAFANAIPGVDDVKAMTWTTTVYIRYTSADGKRTWIETQRRLHAYRHPGLYRETLLDRDGKPHSVRITNARAGRLMVLDLRAKKAVLKAAERPRDDRGPFAWVGVVFRERKNGEWKVTSLSLQGPKQVGQQEVNVVRVVAKSVMTPGKLRTEFHFDTDSKQLVGISSPNPGHGFDLEAVPDRDNKSEEKWSTAFPYGSRMHEMVVDAKLDAEQFSLDPPAGFAVEKKAKSTVTEEEMIAFLGAAARFNDNEFPDSPYDAFDREKFNAASMKKPADRTKEAQALIAIRDKIMLREIYRAPVLQFEQDHVVPGSFHYVGSGVKVGQADRIVGWYQLREGNQHRAVYGDLSVKDVTEAELPLKLGK